MGIDTWRVVRYLDEDRELRAASALCTQPTRRGLMAPEKVAGHRVGVIPGHRMLWCEGHPAVDGLAAPASLAVAEEQLLAGLSDVGMPLGRDGGVGRLDQTVTLEFGADDEGLLLLAGLAAVDVPRLKPAIYGRPPETVYLLGARSGRALARAYDKGLESGTAPRGRLVRLENQTRFGKEARMRAQVHAEAPELPARLFEGRFAPVAESCHGITAATLPVLADEVRERVQDGRMTFREAERLSGYLLLGDALPVPRTTRWRRRRELRDHGLVLGDPLRDPLRVDLGGALEAALEAWSDG